MSRITTGPSTRTGVPTSPTVTRRPVDRTDGPAPALGEPIDGRSARWADHREARRAELVRIARKAVHQRGPDVSMEEIAAAAGTSKSIVYRYFSDKTGLQIAVAEAVVLQIQGALEGVLRVAPTPREGLRGMVAVYLEMIESSPNVYAFVTRDGSIESGGPLGHFLDAVTALVAAPFARGLTDDAGAAVRPDERPPGVQVALAEAWAAGAVGFVRGAGEWWLAHRREPGSPDRAQVTAQVAAWLWAGPVGLLARERGSRPSAGPPYLPTDLFDPTDRPTDQPALAPEETR